MAYDLAAAERHDRVAEVCSLPAGWLGNGLGEAVQCRPEDVMDACRALYAIGRCNFGIFPTPDGEVQLECDDGFEIRVGAR